MSFLNIAGYKFLPLTQLNDLQANFHEFCLTHGIKGTILLSAEGINIALSAPISAIENFKASLQQDKRFLDIHFRQSYSEKCSFKRLKVKLKTEIITFKQPTVDATKDRASSISPTDLKQWLDQAKEFVLLDTRNTYETQMGAFSQAIQLNIDDFSELPSALPAIDKQKAVVMYCTGGIRCEKAALYMQQAGFEKVYQLDGGILNYFAQVGGAHYQGNCFVFDERIAVNPELEAI